MSASIARKIEDCESFLRYVKSSCEKGEWDAAIKSCGGLMREATDLLCTLADAELDAIEDDLSPSEIEFLMELRASDDRERAGAMAGEIS